MEPLYLPHISRDSRSGRGYFMEFTVIFLAVALGFLAENILMNFIELTKTKNYAQLLCDDLRVDTAIIQQSIQKNAWIEAKYDSVENILASPDFYSYNEFIYYVDKYLSVNDNFTPQDNTFQHLKSTGNFRYFKNIDLSKKIEYYYSLCSQVQQNDNRNISKESNGLAQIESRLFNVRDLASLTNNKGNTYYTQVFRPTLKLKPIYRDVDNLKLLFMKVDEARNQSRTTNITLRGLKEHVINLMSDLKREYHLN